jgi:hypothetical protein
VLEVGERGPVAVPQKFVAVDVMLDSGKAQLGAYQITLVAETPDVRLVGVEGGEHEAFAQAPFYDPAALQRDRVILAAYSVQDHLPVGMTRVARLHIACDEGTNPAFIITLDAAADAQARALPAETVHATIRTLEAAHEGGEPSPADTDQPAPTNESTPADSGEPTPEGINP